MVTRRQFLFALQIALEIVGGALILAAAICVPLVIGLAFGIK